MIRPPILIAIISLCASGSMADGVTKTPSLAARKKAQAAKEARVRIIRRVLFRTSSPHLFSPTPEEGADAAPHYDRAWPRLIVPRDLPKKEPESSPEPEPKPEITHPVSTRALALRDLGVQPTTFTPYDRYLGTVRSVIANTEAHHSSMALACQLVSEGRHFRYVASDPYRAQSPQVTATRHAGDCKSKALWLYDHLGDPAALYVIGKLERHSHLSHAWVYWNCDDRWWILDPTISSGPIATDSVSSNRYVPYYSYSRAGSFRHKATSLMLAGWGSHSCGAHGQQLACVHAPPRDTAGRKPR